MTVRNVLTFPDPRLRTKAVPVERVDGSVRELVRDMFETMYAEGGIGLAATQVDVHLQVVVMNLTANPSAGEELCLINPRITERQGEQICEEGCLSVPGVFAEVSRANHIVVEALDKEGRAFKLSAQDLLAVCVQHELDHLHGKLFVDYLSELKREKVRKLLHRQQKAGTNETLPKRILI